MSAVYLILMTIAAAIALVVGYVVLVVVLSFGSTIQQIGG